jgi:hypothetical protein
MTFRLLKEQARRAVESAVAAADYPSVEFDVSEPPKKESLATSRAM